MENPIIISLPTNVVQPVFLQWYSGCGDAERLYSGNVNQCKYASEGFYEINRFLQLDMYSKDVEPYDQTKCTCSGLLCNAYDQHTDVIHKLDPRFVMPAVEVKPVEATGKSIYWH